MLIFNILYLVIMSIIMVNWFLLISKNSYDSFSHYWLVLHHLLQYNSLDFHDFDTLDTITEFNEWITFSLVTRRFLVLLSVGVVLITIKLLVVLNTQFPSFGILFYTIATARKELFIFAVVIT